MKKNKFYRHKNKLNFISYKKTNTIRILRTDLKGGLGGRSVLKKRMIAYAGGRWLEKKSVCIQRFFYSLFYSYYKESHKHALARYFKRKLNSKNSKKGCIHHILLFHGIKS